MPLTDEQLKATGKLLNKDSSGIWILNPPLEVRATANTTHIKKGHTYLTNRYNEAGRCLLLSDVSANWWSMDMFELE